MAISSTFLYIYSNDGLTNLISENPNTPSLLTVTKSGATITDQSGNSYNSEYTYSGDKTFVGFATSANATEAVYTEGDTITLSNNTTKLYIVEADPTPTDAVTIEYNGAVIASLKAGQSATLQCKSTEEKPNLMLTDIIVTVPKGMGAGEVVEEWDGSIEVV